jgi:cytoskeletal protein CcmA (bactofilin family)
MAINTKILSDIAFKKLAGASHTTVANSALQESIASNVQLSSDVIFGQKIPGAPGNPASTDIYTTASNAGGEFVVQLVEFDLVALASSVYAAGDSSVGGQGDAVDSGDTTSFDQVDSGEANTLTTHSFALQFPSNYVASQANGKNNPLAGTGVGFDNNAFVHDSKGRVQIVPTFFNEGSVDYLPRLTDENGNALDIGGSAQDFYLDTFAGVLFRQDGNNSLDASSDLYAVPKKLKAYVYIGKMQSESIDTSVPSLADVTAVGATTSQDIVISASLTVHSGSNSELVDFTNVDFSGSNGQFDGNLGVNGNSSVIGNIEAGGNLNVDGNITVGGNQTITGDLIVNGSTTTINTTDLLVEDRFILLASGNLADAPGDGGIIVQTGQDDAGKNAGTALFYDADRLSWGISAATSSLSSELVGHEDDDITAQVNVLTVDIQNGAPLSTGGSIARPRPLMGGNNAGQDGRFALGQMYVDYNDTTNGGLYIYLPE